MAKQIKINKCSDSRMWYANRIGCVETVVRTYRDHWIVLDPEGYTNIVMHTDAEEVESKNEL